MRPSLFRPAVFATVCAAVALAAASPRPARAQPTTRTFEACVYGPFQTCSSLQLTTTPTPPFTLGFPLFGGTSVDLLVRQTTLSGRATGLSALSFLYGPAVSFGPDTTGAADLSATGGVPAPGAPSAWSATAGTTRLDLLHADVRPGAPPGSTPPGGTQYVAGCAGGAFAGGLLTTALVTCLPGAYRFQFVTERQFSAADVWGFGFDLYAGTDADAPNGRTVTCTFDAVGPLGGACLDFANLDDPFVAFGAPAAAVVPEPAAVVLVGAGLLTLAVGARRRRG